MKQTQTQILAIHIYKNWKVNVLCKVLNNQFIEKLRAIFFDTKCNYTPLQTVPPFGRIIKHNKTLGPHHDPPKSEIVYRGM